jgi:hypothetical protein
MLGTDRVGFQFKKELGVNLPSDSRLGVADTVARFSYNWDAGMQEELLVEKNFLKVPLMRTTAVGGVPLSVDVVPGARFNVTGNQQITPSLNVDAAWGSGLNSKPHPHLSRQAALSRTASVLNAR